MKFLHFLSNEPLWQEIKNIIHDTKRADVAIAYLGQGGADRLPLKSGSRLVVDISKKTVKAGGTDPREIKKLIERGVEVFTRPNLHAKVVLTKAVMICGSMNVSGRSEKELEEAAIMTSDPVAMDRARDFIDRLCKQPVLPEYLKECMKLYEPPSIGGPRGNKNHRVKRTKPTQLRVLSLVDGNIPDDELKR